MTDIVIDALVDYVDRLDFSQLDETTLASARTKFVDSVGCMIGGMPSEPGRIARDYAANPHTQDSASLMGGGVASVENATFANTVMQRYLDFNDSNPGGGHFSDLIPCLIAVGESVGASGADLVSAIVAGYEVASQLASVTRIRLRGWDNATYLNIASALAAGKLMQLSRSQLGHAASMASISGISTWASREGEVSMWKACASASACRHGVFSARLAGRGMTGPSDPISGRFGLAEQVAGTAISVAFGESPKAVNASAIKMFPCQDDAQGPVEIALALSQEVSVDTIRRIEIESFHITYSPDGERVHPHKWDPKTRETADHSLPYLVAVALVDQRVDLGSFVRERYLDPKLRPLMDKITIRQNPEFKNRYPAEMVSSIEIEDASGIHHRSIIYPLGHPENPMSYDEINDKFTYLANIAASDQGACQDLLEMSWHVDKCEDIRTFGTLFQSIEPVAKPDF